MGWKGNSVLLCFALSLTIGLSAAQNARDAILEVDMRILGPNVLPFSQQNQNAVISGVSNLLQDGVTASDISLTVLRTYNNATANGNRRLLQSSFPAVDLALNITTSASKAQNESQALIAASNQTYALASTIGAQGLQTQQIVIQSINTLSTSTPSPAPQSSPPPIPPLVSGPPPAQAPEAILTASQAPTAQVEASPPPPEAQAPAPLGTASGSGTSADGSAKSSSGLSGGAIAGIAVGGFVLACILLAGLILWRRRNRSKSAEQADVIDYYSGIGKPGVSHQTGPIVADSTRSSRPASAGLPAGAKVSFTENAGKTDDKVEYSEGGEKIEAPRQPQSPAKFMDVQL